LGSKPAPSAMCLYPTEIKGPWLATVCIETPVSEPILCVVTGKDDAGVFISAQPQIPSTKKAFPVATEPAPVPQRCEVHLRKI
jgi:hypothetical protein